METDINEYFERSLALLDRYRWLHDIKMTEFLIRRPWLDMPEEWKAYVLSRSTQAGDLVTSSTEKDCPSTLKSFFEECAFLTRPCENSDSCSTRSGQNGFRLAPSQKRRLTAKKIHEIERLAPLIKDVCGKHGCQVVIDLGCGMGYLAQVLAESFDLMVLGVDCDSGHCEKAQYRAISSDKQIGQRVRYVSFKLGQSKNDASFLQQLVGQFRGDKDESNIPSCILVSLHGCGDLQPISYELFASSAFIKAMIGIGCCYHKMATTEERYRNFPLSQRFKSVWTTTAPNLRFSPYSLRVASQEKLERWRTKLDIERKRHANFVGFRALIELLDFQTGTKSEKLHRHYFREEHMADFDSFRKAISHRTSVGGEPGSDYAFRLSAAYEECRDDFKVIEDFTSLQSALAGVMESVILYDRLLFLEESGFLCSLKPLFDSFISPRNMILSAERKN